jgi:hypothetical protein
MEQHNKDVPATDFGNTASFVAEPIGWLEAPHGTFRRNHSVSVTFPPQSAAWSIPVFLGSATPDANTGA